MIDKKYLREQVKNPTGHFAEILIRTYYYISQKCKAKNQDWCYDKEITNYELKKFTYANINYGASLMVVKNAKNTLATLDYIKRIKDGENWTIHIIKPLDFLDGDIEEYVSKPHDIIKKRG